MAPKTKEWGGRREGAGRKPTWKSGKCKAIKLPVVLVDEVVKYARRLDAGGTPTLPAARPIEVKPPAPPERDPRWAQVSQLIDEKSVLQRKLRHLEEALATERKKLDMAMEREKKLQFGIADARSVLLNAYQEQRCGVRFRVRDVKSALLALGLDVDTQSAAHIDIETQSKER